MRPSHFVIPITDFVEMPERKEHPLSTELILQETFVLVVT